MQMHADRSRNVGCRRSGGTTHIHLWTNICTYVYTCVCVCVCVCVHAYIYVHIREFNPTKRCQAQVRSGTIGIHSTTRIRHNHAYDVSQYSQAPRRPPSALTKCRSRHCTMHHTSSMPAADTAIPYSLRPTARPGEGGQWRRRQKLTGLLVWRKTRTSRSLRSRCPASWHQGRRRYTLRLRCSIRPCPRWNPPPRGLAARPEALTPRQWSG